MRAKNQVKSEFSSYPDHIKPKMERLRALIYGMADSTDGVGKLEETLKLGESAYLTLQTRSGTTIRIDWKAKSRHVLCLYVGCSTTLIQAYRSRFRNKLDFEGKRAIKLPVDKPLIEKSLRSVYRWPCVIILIRACKNTR